MNEAYLCLGGNIEDRELALKQAILKINREVGEIVAKSGIYETEAWGVDNQQAYLNQCVKLQTDLHASDLIHTLLAIEKELGRERMLSGTYEPRIIDIDVLFFNDAVIESDALIVPHPRLHLRKFVLIPLQEIAPDYLHPVLNKTIFSLLSDCQDTSDVKLYKSY
ncbi:MAG: 2-amino-4-hydroxy-6-hydroxymethyldihydropteridine diphosphokinase [Bacteroidetes bacterium]|nr:2-amino-4-hydroxy-6-hydroxymethyldihydropteridine diphosphokinase [Bacteroidota bacterium]